MKRDQTFVRLTWGAAAVCLAAVAAIFFAVASADAQTPAPPPLPAGLVLHFTFDEASKDNVIADGSGRNNNGQASGARWTSSGRQGGGCELRPNTHIVVPNSESLKVKQATFAVWFRTTKFDNVWRRILDKGIDQGSGFALGIGGESPELPSKGRVACAVNKSGPCLSERFVVDGAWHHAAATFDGENLALYIDGVPQKQVLASPGEIAANDANLTIGMIEPDPPEPGKHQSFQGAIDDVMIFNRALSAEEIKTMVTAVDPLAGKPKFSKRQVIGRLRELQRLFEEGLLTEDFYERKVLECEVIE